jgi:hypothetical protein
LACIAVAIFGVVYAWIRKRKKRTFPVSPVSRTIST